MIKNIFEPDNGEVYNFLIDKLANWQISKLCITNFE